MDTHARLVRRFSWLLAMFAGCRADVPAAVPAAAAPVAATETTPVAAPAAAEPLPIQWDELEVPLGPEEDFEPWMISTAIKSLDGRRIRITGFMYAGGLSQASNIREFVMVKHIGCQFGTEGQPQHVIMVELQDKLRTSFTTQAVTVEGRFAVKPYTGPDGRTWALYRLDGTKIEKGEP